MIKLFNYKLLFVLILLAPVYAQTIGEQKLLEMKNSFILGLPEKGLETGAELMSRNEYADVREDATFYIAELFFTLAIQEDDNINPSKAYTYYLVLQKEYPNSKYATTVNRRINNLIAFFQNNALFRNLFDINQNEATIVQKKLNFTEKLFTFNFPNAYLFFLDGNNDDPTSEVLSRYYDEIIVNIPEFEIYASYYKMISKLGQYWGNEYLSDGWLKYNRDMITFKKGKAGLNLQTTLNKDLDNLSLKYPHHPLTLNLHLIFAKSFLDKTEGVIDSETKQHLEFVIQNELDKTHPRYLLAREFLLNNNFK